MNSHQRRRKRRFWKFILWEEKKKHRTGGWLYFDYGSRKGSYNVSFNHGYISITSCGGRSVEFYYDLMVPDLSSASFLEEVKPIPTPNLFSFPSYRISGTKYILTPGKCLGTFKWIVDTEQYEPSVVSAQEVFDSLSEEQKKEFLWHLETLGSNT